MDGQKLRLCQDFLFETDDNVSVDADPHQQPSQDSADAPMGSSRHQISKKYGGFMKRYGGFMSRRSSSAQEVPSNQESQNEEENIRLGILNIISATKDGGLEEGSDEDEEAAKSYGGFRGHGEGVVVKGNLLEAVLGHGLKKRYGGFMRRVGRPEWLLDNGKSGGALKSGWENGGGLQKRYGGFMD